MKRKIYVFFLIFCLIISMLPLESFDSFAYASETTVDTSFVKLQLENEKKEILKDMRDGDVSEYELTPGTTYYIKATVKRPENINYVALRLGSDDGSGNLSPNGLKFLSPPGGRYVVGDIVHDSFDKLVKVTGITDYTYGSGSTNYVLNDGELIYHIKDSIKKDTYFDFEFSFAVDGIAYNNLETLINGLSVAMFQNEDKTGTSIEADFDLSVKQKSGITTRYNTSSVTLAPGSGVNTPFIISGAGVEFLYDKIEYDIEYPEDATLEGIGFDSNYSASSTQYGNISVGAPEDSTEGYKKVHVTAGPGKKEGSADLWYYYKIVFPEDKYSPGDVLYSKIKNVKAYLAENENPIVAPSESVVKHIIVDPRADSTYLSAKNRVVYNITNDTDHNYYVQLGNAYLSNSSTAPTYESKIIEADYNTTNTAAEITAITVPRGSKDVPTIQITGKNASGKIETKSIGETLTPKKLTTSGISYGYYLIFAKDYGFTSIISMKADIGSITAKYASSTWQSKWSVEYNLYGAYGKFTTSEEGIEVVNKYHVYNKDPEARDYPNGDLTARSVAVSTLRNMVGISNLSFNTYNQDGASINTAPSIEAGRDFTIKSTISIMDNPESASNTNGTDNGNGIMKPDTSSSKMSATASAIYNPVFYLFLPKGMTYKSLKFYFDQYNGMLSTRPTPYTESIDYKISNVSYLNETGDGVSIYKITFPENTGFGSYMEEGGMKRLRYEATFSTSRSMATGSYPFNNLIQLTSESGLTGAVYGNGVSINVKADKYGVNSGNYLVGATSGQTEAAIHLQEISEIQVENAISVTKINNQTVANPQWFTYSTTEGKPDGNSIALLGMKSEGRIRVGISNRGSDASNKVEVVMPIPQKGVDMGDMFMEGESQYSMNVTWDEESLPDGFTAKYVVLTPQDEQGAFTYRDLQAGEKGNAVLLSTDRMAGRSTEDCYFNYSIENGQPKEINIFRTAHTYTASSGQVFNRIGSYVAAQVATGTVTGTVFYDSNRNGVQDETESGLPGVEVIVTDSMGRIQTVLTDENGKYKFDAVREDDVVLSYKVKETDEVLGEYRYNIPVEGMNHSEDGLSSAKTYESIVESTVNDVPMGTYYSVVYDANGAGGNLPAATNCPENEFVTVKKNPDTLKKTSYAFKEWNTKADGTGNAYLPGSTVQVTEEACGYDSLGKCDRTLELYAIWEPAKYLVSLNYKGGTPVVECTSFYIQGEEQKFSTAYKDETGEEMPLLWLSGATEYTNGLYNFPVKNGYIFKGWTFTPTNENKKLTLSWTVANQKLSDDAVLYAIWQPKQGYTIKYNTGEGATLIDTRSNVKWNDTVYAENKPEKVGYSFEGWSFDQNKIDTSATYGSLAVNDDVNSIELTALWKEKDQFLVKYQSDGFEPKKVSWNSKELYPLEEPSKEGYAFMGWSDSEDGTCLTGTETYASLVDNDDTVEEITLYLIWQEIAEGSVLVKYNTSGGTVIADKITTKDQSHLLPDSNPNRLGYIFSEWKYNDIVVDQDTTYESLAGEATTITLKAQWVEKQYTITYDKNSDSAQGVFPNTLKKWKDEEILPATPPIDKGYTFNGWYYKNMLVSILDSVSSLVPNDDAGDTLNLIGHWIKTKYNVEYNSNGGSYLSPTTGLFYDSKIVQEDAVPIKKGYSFAGWTFDDTAVGRETKVSDVIGDSDETTILLNAKYTEKTGFVVKYETSGGTSYDDKQNVSWTEKNLIPSEQPKKKGYEFQGWICGRTEVNDSTSYSSLAESDNPDTYITLVAQWESQEYSIIYKDGEEVYDWGDKAHPATYTYGIAQDLTEAYKDEYTFQGWYRNSTLSGDKVSRLSADETANDAGQIVLYAKWKATKFDINIKSSKVEWGTVSGGGSFTENTIVQVSAHPNAGYTFVRWTENGSEVSKDANYKFKVSGNRNLVAVFASKVVAAPVYISASANSGGSIYPSGNVGVNMGSNYTFTFKPDKGYKVKDVVIDGESIGPMASYEFISVFTGHTIKVVFEKQQQESDENDKPQDDNNIDKPNDGSIEKPEDEGIHQPINDNQQSSSHDCNPKTGDTVMIYQWLILMALSIFALCVVCAVSRKKKVKTTKKE